MTSSISVMDVSSTRFQFQMHSSLTVSIVCLKWESLQESPFCFGLEGSEIFVPSTLFDQVFYFFNLIPFLKFPSTS